jgi:hypothetical protein
MGMILDEAQKAAKRQLYRSQIEILENYRSKVKQAFTRFKEGEQIYRSSHSWYSPNWQGGTKTEYDKISNELNGIGKGLYNTGEELLSALNSEIRKLRGKIEDLR